MKRLIVALGVVLLFTALRASGQAALGKFEYQTDYLSRPVTGYVVIMDLKGAAGFGKRVTGRDPRCPQPNTVYRETTTLFGDKSNLFFSITANPGAPVDQSQCGMPIGLIVSDGEPVSSPQKGGPVLYFLSDGDAYITDGALPSRIGNAVAGTATLEAGCTIGTLLVKNGTPQKCALPKPYIAAPRGAMGLDHFRRYLITVVVTGNEGQRVGLSTYDFALILVAFGASNAVNFDGGGSAALYWAPRYGVPELCNDCAARIRDAKIPITFPNPNFVSFAGRPALLPMTEEIIYPAPDVQRDVYASIGFRYLLRK